MSTAREKIVERIRQLREMTAARGCTEAEALSAAAKAAELMRIHGLTDADLVVEEASSILGGKRHRSLQKLWAIIAICTNTSALNVTRARTDSIIFIGQAPGPEIAAYLRDVVDRAVQREIAAFKAGDFYRRRRATSTRKAAIADFIAGLTERLGDRLLTLFEASISKEAMQIACDARDQRYRTTSIDFRERSTRFHSAEAEGWQAGARPQLAHGLGGKNSPQLRIGRAS